MEKKRKKKWFWENTVEWGDEKGSHYNQEKNKEEESIYKNNPLQNLEENLRNVFTCILSKIKNDLASIKHKETIMTTKDIKIKIA